MGIENNILSWSLKKGQLHHGSRSSGSDFEKTAHHSFHIEEYSETSYFTFHLTAECEDIWIIIYGKYQFF